MVTLKLSHEEENLSKALCIEDKRKDELLSILFNDVKDMDTLSKCIEEIANKSETNEEFAFLVYNLGRYIEMKKREAKLFEEGLMKLTKLLDEVGVVSDMISPSSGSKQTSETIN